MKLLERLLAVMQYYISVIQYHISVVLFNIRFTLFGDLIEKTAGKIKKGLIIWRLFFVDGISQPKTIAIVNRYFERQLYIRRKESKEACHMLMEFIGEWSNSSGLPQWEIRSLISRDFHIDV